MTNDGKYANTGGLKKVLSYLKGLLDGKADKATTLEGYGITDAFKYKGQVNGESVDSNLWSDYGVKGYDNILPDGMEDAYPYGVLVSFADADKTFQFFSSEDSTGNGGIKWRSGKDEDKGEWHDLSNLDTEQVFTEKQTFEKGFAVGSNVLVENLNADLLDGYEASDFATKEELAEEAYRLEAVEEIIGDKGDDYNKGTLLTRLDALESLVIGEDGDQTLLQKVDANTLAISLLESNVTTLQEQVLEITDTLKWENISS